jgi:hypothetical protein
MDPMFQNRAVLTGPVGVQLDLPPSASVAGIHSRLLPVFSVGLKRIVKINALLSLAAFLVGVLAALATRTAYPVGATLEVPTWLSAWHTAEAICRNNMLVTATVFLGLPFFGLSGYGVIVLCAFRFGFGYAGYGATDLSVLPFLSIHGPMEIASVVLANSGIQAVGLGLTERLVTGARRSLRPALQCIFYGFAILLVAAPIEVGSAALRKWLGY